MMPLEGIKRGKLNKKDFIKARKERKRKERNEYKFITRKMNWYDTSEGFICNVHVLEEHYRFISRIVKELGIYCIGHRAFVPCKPDEAGKSVASLAKAADCAVYTFYYDCWKQNVAFRLPKDRMTDLDRKIEEYCSC